MTSGHPGNLHLPPPLRCPPLLCSAAACTRFVCVIYLISSSDAGHIKKSTSSLCPFPSRTPPSPFTALVPPLLARPCPVHDCKNLLAISHNCQCVGNDATATNCGNMLHTGADKQCHSPTPLYSDHPLHLPLFSAHPIGSQLCNPLQSLPLHSFLMWRTLNHLTCSLTVNFGLHFGDISANPSRRPKRFR